MARTPRPLRGKSFPTAEQRPKSVVTMVDFAVVHTSAVKAVSEGYLQCRTLGHAWTHSVISRDVREKGLPVQWVQELLCTRCPVTKKQILNSSGEIVSSNYTYPADYKFDAEGGPNRLDRAAMRMRIVKSPGRFI